MGFISSFLEESLFTSLLSARRLDGYQLSQVVPLTPANLPWDFIGWAEVFCLIFLMAWYLSWPEDCTAFGQGQHGSRSGGDISVGPSAVPAARR